MKSEILMDEKLFHKVAEECADLVTKKNKAYGNSFELAGEILKILFPDGVKVDQYQDMLTVTRVLDKLFRICSGDKKAFEENPWRDILGYSLLSVCSEEANDENKSEELIPHKFKRDTSKDKFKPGDKVYNVHNRNVHGIVASCLDTTLMLHFINSYINKNYVDGKYMTCDWEKYEDCELVKDGVRKT